MIQLEFENLKAKMTKVMVGVTKLLISVLWLLQPILVIIWFLLKLFLISTLEPLVQVVLVIPETKLITLNLSAKLIHRIFQENKFLKIY